jgi:hypothetical protein
MSDVDTMRWGDSQTLLMSGIGENAAPVSGQLLNAHWQRPCVWRLMLAIQPNITAGDTTVFVVNVLLRVGVGQANSLIPLATFVFAPTAGVYTGQTTFFDVPAQDMQVQFSAGVQGGGTPMEPGDSITVSAFAAPHAEPAGISQIRDGIAAGIREPDQDGQPRWMPPGFNDGQLRYR